MNGVNGRVDPARYVERMHISMSVRDRLHEQRQHQRGTQWVWALQQVVVQTQIHILLAYYITSKDVQSARVAAILRGRCAVPGKYMKEKRKRNTHPCQIYIDRRLQQRLGERTSRSGK